MTAPRQLRSRAHVREPIEEAKQSKYWSDPREPIPTNQGQKIENKRSLIWLMILNEEKN